MARRKNKMPKTGDVVEIYGIKYRVRQWRDTKSGELHPLDGSPKIYYGSRDIKNMKFINANG